MSEFFNDASLEMDTMKQHTNVDSAPTDGVETDVPGVKASGLKNSLPVFDVDSEDFFKNMKADRQRLRFKPETTASQYLRQTKYRTPFFIRTEKDGQQYMRKVK